MITRHAAVRSTLRWLPRYTWQRRPWRRRPPRPTHLVIAVADHFEPAIVADEPGRFAPLDEQVRRVERWCRRSPRAMDYRDADGYPLRHTYFYPAEQFHPAVLEPLAAHCHAGWGELEVHLHHGIDTPATAEETRAVLVEFRDALAALGCLSRWNASGPPRYAFVHGNWALANSAGGRWCGVDDEMQILAETGCYADLTLPSAPAPAQIAKVNAVYECARPLTARAPHRRGRDLECGRVPTTLPLIVQGPLALDLGRGLRPRIENGELSARRPPSLERARRWIDAAIGVRGRPEWCFIKLHCHGMDPRDEDLMLGPALPEFLETLSQAGPFALHLVTAREMVNVLLAACDGREGNPGEFRDYRLRRTARGRVISPVDDDRRRRAQNV